MSDRALSSPKPLLSVALTLTAALLLSDRVAADDEPPALNPFAPRKTADDSTDEPPALNPFGAVKQARDDAVPGY